MIRSAAIGCEFSGIVRSAMRAAGWDAWSIDLLPAEDDSPFHIQGDIFDALKARKWHRLIFHWPCTLLCLSGVRWLYGGKGKTKDIARWAAMEESATSFRRLLDCGIPEICGENPIPHPYAKAIMGDYSQIVQPWQFGHGETKATCLWLRGLPPLQPTEIVTGRKPRVHHASPGPNRWKERSRTLPGIARAMASQWGNLLSQQSR